MVLLLAVLPLVLLLLLAVVVLLGVLLRWLRRSETSRDAVFMYFGFLLRVVELRKAII